MEALLAIDPLFAGAGVVFIGLLFIVFRIWIKSSVKPPRKQSQPARSAAIRQVATKHQSESENEMDRLTPEGRPKVKRTSNYHKGSSVPPEPIRPSRVSRSSERYGNDRSTTSGDDVATNLAMTHAVILANSDPSPAPSCSPSPSCDSSFGGSDGGSCGGGE